MTGSERPSPEPLLNKKNVPSRTGGRQFWKCSGASKCLELQCLGDPSRTLEGNSRKRSESVSGVFPEFFRNFFRKVPAVLGAWPIKANSPRQDLRPPLGRPTSRHSLRPRFPKDPAVLKILRDSKYTMRSVFTMPPRFTML